jgi:hypothetical protein
MRRPTPAESRTTLELTMPPPVAPVIFSTAP